MARVQIAINREKCPVPIRCRKCVEVCPQCLYKLHLVKIDKGKEMPEEAWDLDMWFPDQCVGCLECVKVCPENALRVIAPCEAECPAHVDVPSIVSLIAAGRTEEALHLHRERNPFVEISARVCPHPCESLCERKRVDSSSIAVRGVKRYMADLAAAKSTKIKDLMRENPNNAKKKVAVIGAGPAGLSCAYFLRKIGHPVTIFEKADRPGGMLSLMIPSYRLPQDVVDREVNFVLSSGIELKLNTTVGKDITFEDLKKQGYEAIFLGMGAWRSTPLGVPGEELEGVISAMDMLKDYRKGIAPKLGKKVVVIGGGNAAIDAARTAFRFGSDVTVVYRRDRDEMPAIPAEIEEAEKEGVKFILLARPLKVEGKNGHVSGLACGKMMMKGYDNNARRRSVPIEGSDFTVEADTVIIAIGQKLDANELLQGTGIGLSYEGYIYADHHMTTTIPYIFAGGDVTKGPSSVVEAIGAGERAARAINHYLSKELPADQKTDFWWIEPYEDDISYNTRSAIPKYERAVTPLVPVSERVGAKEVEMTMSAEDALHECARCLRCDYVDKEVLNRILSAAAAR